MSKADKMFEELGFVKTKDTLIENVMNWVVIYHDQELYGRQRKITFLDHYCYVTLRDVYDDKDITGACVDKDLHLAIHEKMKELGWI